MTKLQKVKANPEQKAWFFYDWANSAYITTIGTVLYAPYLTSVAERAACGFVGDDDRKCVENLSVLGLSVSAGSLVFYVVTLATVISAFVLPIVGRDRRPGRVQEDLDGRPRVVRCGRGGPDVLRHRHQLAARGWACWSWPTCSMPRRSWSTTRS